MAQDTYLIRPRDDFDHFAEAVRSGFARALEDGDGALFSTRPTSGNRRFLSEAYLNSFHNEGDRQVHTCSACQSFLNRFGNLVVISKTDGHIRSALFGYLKADEVPDHFKPAATALAVELDKVSTKIINQFWWPDSTWGTNPASTYTQGWMMPVSNEYEWRHFQVSLPAKYMSKDRVRTPGQARSFSRERYGMVERGLRTIGLPAYEQTVAALKSGTIPTASKFLATAEARLDLKKKYDTLQELERDAFLWKIVSTSTEGFTRFTSDALSTLTKDFQDGVAPDVASARFSKTTNEVTYQVTTAPVKAGNVRQAENLFSKLNLAPALARSQVSRSDTVLEDFACWKPSAQPSLQVQTPTGQDRTTGVFGAVLKAAKETKATIHGAQISMKTLLEKHLPTATSLQVKVDVDGYIGSLTKATDDDAAPLLAWDTPEYRNSYCWYRWPGVKGSDFGLTEEWATVTRVLPLPSQWGETKSHHKGYYLELEAGEPAFPDYIGSGLFIEALAPDLKSVRRTIQAHSVMGSLGTVPDPTLGVIVRDVASIINMTVAVHSNSAVTVFTVTSWE